MCHIASMARDYASFDTAASTQSFTYEIREQHQFCNFIITPSAQVDVTINYYRPDTDAPVSMGTEATFTCPAGEATPISVPHRLPKVEIVIGMSATGVIEVVRY